MKIQNDRKYSLRKKAFLSNFMDFNGGGWLVDGYGGY